MVCVQVLLVSMDVLCLVFAELLAKYGGLVTD